VIPIVSIVGKSKVGKTTFMEKLIAELRSRGFRVAVIKHSAHDFEIDHPGKDTYRHAQAGAEAIAIASPHKVALVKSLEKEPSIQVMLDMIGPEYDIILTEGYKRGPFPKVEIYRKGISDRLVSREDDLIAIVTDNSFSIDKPHFDLEDASGVADLIEKRFLLARKSYERAL